jgi:hypothetical protein
VSRNPVGICVACAAAFALCAAAPAAAQQQSDAGPYGNLFKGSGKPQTQSLDIRGGLFGGYDDNLLAQAPGSDQTNQFDPRFQVPGVTTGFQSSATYGYVHAFRGRSANQFRFAGTASLQEFTGADKKPFWAQNYGSGTSFGTNLTPKVSLAANLQASYAPYYQYVPFLTNGGSAASGSSFIGVAPDGVAADTGSTSDVPTAVANPTQLSVNPVGTDIGFATQSQFVGTATAGISITDRFTKRASISADTELTESAAFGQGHARVESRLARAQIGYKLTRKIGVHLGYGLQDVRYSQETLPSARVQNHLLDFGIDYGDGGSISFARYYTFSFSTGVSALRNGSETFFRLDGSVALARRIGRTWSTSVGAARGTSYVLGFSNPIYTDSVFTALGGQIVQRLSFTTGANYVRGQNAFSSSSGVLVSKSASARLTFALSQHLGLYSQSSYYQYDVPDGFFSTVAFTQHQNRRSASVGLTFWAPLINQRTARQP